MAEKHTPSTIWACMEGPMVGLFVSGGYTAGWPKYIRADSHDKLVQALKAIRELSGLDHSISGASAVVMSRMADIHQHSDAALASLDQESGQ